MSNTVSILRIINALLALVTVAQELGVNVTKLLEMQAIADSEGRQLSDDELDELQGDAQAAIDAITSTPPTA